MQSKIDNWFSVTKTKTYEPPPKKIKTVFYCNWQQNKPKTYWLDKVPNDINFQGKVRWREYKEDIIVCGNIRYEDEDYIIPPETMYKTRHMTYLKSHLQKCVRRKLNKKALKTAFHMIKLNIVEFLRRLPIIMMEDTYLHSSLSTVVWLMAVVSLKKLETDVFCVQENHIKWLLGVVNTICNIENVDTYKTKEHIDSISNYNILSGDRITQLYSLQFRSAYGGMLCDQHMLNYLSDLWYIRYKNGENHIDTEIKEIEMNGLYSLYRTEWEMSAIDFHNAVYIPDMLSNKYEEFDVDDIKKAIWNNSSKINYRYDKNDNRDTDEIWEKIKKDLEIIQKSIISKIV